MAHEIETTDTPVFAEKPAWHGLGTVLDSSFSPEEAAKRAYPWHVFQESPYVNLSDDKVVMVQGMKVNFRSDTLKQLGVVSDSYHVIQPAEMCQFVADLATEGKVEIESAGSIRGGERIWILARGSAFDIGGKDHVVPYVLVSNGFDGTSTFRVTPTTVRVVCSNTLHSVIPQTDTGKLVQGSISIRHTSNVMDRIEEVRKSLMTYSKAIDSTRKFAETLMAKDVSKADVESFFLDAYQTIFSPIPVNPKNKAEERAREKSKSAFGSFSRRFDDESTQFGANVWVMANALSGCIQHDLKSRGQNDPDRVEKRVDSNLFGLSQERTQTAFQLAFKLAH